MTELRVKRRASRRILQAMGLFSGIRILNILCSLVRNKLIAVFVGPWGIGMIALFNSVVDLVCQMSRLSIDQTAQRDISQSSSQQLSLTLTVVRRWSVILGLGGLLLMCVCSPLLSLWTFDTFDRWPVFCLLSVMPLLYAYSSCITAENQGLRRFKQLAGSSVVTALVGLSVTVPLVIWLRNDSIVWIIVAYGLAAWIGAFIYRPRFQKQMMEFKELAARGAGFIKLGALMTMAIVVTQALNYFFILYLNTFASTVNLGIYQSGYTMLSSYIGIIFTALWFEYYPRLSACAHSPRRLSLAASHELRLAAGWLTPLLCILILFIRPIIYLVYSADFYAAEPYIVLGAVGTVFKLSSWCQSYVILAKGDGRTFFKTEAVSGIVGLALNVAGYRVAGFYGLGAAYIVWYLFYTVMIAYICGRKYNVYYSARTWGVLAIALIAVSLFAAVTLIGEPFSSF